MAAKRLSGLDSGFLALDNPTMHLHIGVLLLLRDELQREDSALDRVKSQFSSRIDAMENFQSRVVEVPLGIVEPFWARVQDFKIDDHIVEANFQGDFSELMRYSGDFISKPLAKDRPLWQVEVVDSIQDRPGSFAVIAKIHHALIDGVMGIEVLANLFDFEPNPSSFWGGDIERELDSDGELNSIEIFTSIIGDVLNKVREAPKIVDMLGRAALDFVNYTKTEENTSHLPALFTAPRTPMSGSLTAERVVTFLDLPLDRFKELARELNVTVNDLSMAVVSFALDRYLEMLGHQGGEDLVSMMPMSNPGRDRSTANQISALLVSLGNSISDPVDRIKFISAATKKAKEFHRRAQLERVTSATSLMPPALTSALSNLAHRLRAFDAISPAFNILISSVKGPSSPLYLAGSELVSVIPFGPLAESVPLNVTVVSYCADLVFGIVSDERSRSSLDTFANFITAVFEELSTTVLPME
ncbi:MAG: wax ester/triacylglycerol synthase family O-acyltransferase [Actinomycetota bacterium]|nr:wax ester/triacylglycerol synthase family O-acyltransferase [Actinomycetota bacterium]